MFSSQTAAFGTFGGRWRWRRGGGKTVGKNGNGNQNNEAFVLLSPFAYFLVSFVVLSSIGSLYARFVLTANVRTGIAALGCREDSEGSWAVGVFYGGSPFSLKPIEAMNIWKNKSAAWPVANPIITCGSLSNAGFPSNFVARPFLFMLGDTIYLFFEAKNSMTMKGDIAVARSADNGATWQHLGVALAEDWHLSYPYVFEHNGNIYMMPESSAKGDVRLYRTTDFPLKWTLHYIILKKPLIDPFLIPHEGKFWLFGSDHSSLGTKVNGHLEIWQSTSPTGPWKPHKKNPIYNKATRKNGARNGGRPFVYNGSLHRIGQDSSESYGRRVRVFRVETLTTDEFKEVEVSFSIERLHKGPNAWNGARYHHLDVQQLSSGKWIGVLDGDRVLSGDVMHRFFLGSVSVAGVAAFIILVGVLLGTVKCIVPLSWCPRNTGKKSDTVLSTENPNIFYNLRVIGSRLNKVCFSLHSKLRPNTCARSMTLVITIVVAIMLACAGVHFIYGGSGAQEACPLDSHYSQFTLVSMTYDARIWNLKMYVRHYSRCSSVGEILIIWNKGIPPKVTDFDSAVPIRIRVESRNSLNNRFSPDPLIKTRAVLELDDDIIMPCYNIERGFRIWRENPDRIVGFYPRLVNGYPVEYRAEKHARKHNGYNMILTGAAFLDSQVAFERYWRDEAGAGRVLVDEFFNCEDVLMNYLYANMSSNSNTVEYVRPRWVVDMSKFSNVAISKNTGAHYEIRSKCLAKFGDLYGSIVNRKVEFGRRKDGWDA